MWAGGSPVTDSRGVRLRGAAPSSGGSPPHPHFTQSFKLNELNWLRSTYYQRAAATDLLLLERAQATLANF